MGKNWLAVWVTQDIDYTSSFSGRTQLCRSFANYLWRSHWNVYDFRQRLR